MKALLLLYLSIFIQSNAAWLPSGVAPVADADLLERDQEAAAPRAGGQAAQGSPNPYRGLGEAEFRRMQAKVKLIKQKFAKMAGKKDVDVGESSLLGDIALTEGQAEALLARLDAAQGAPAGGGGRVRRKVPTTTRWPTTVPYIIDSDAFSALYVSNIRAAISFWEDNTCLTFAEGVPADGSKYMYIQRNYSGCWSYVGKLSGAGKQNINLGGNCASSLAVIIHEIGHALGFFHEQSRPDRDDYVDVLLDKVRAGYEGNFDMERFSDTNGVAYDYGSVMHYGSNGFSTDGSPNLIPKDAEYQKVIGQRVSGSFFDIVGMNYAYGCNVECGGLCKNGGIGDPNTNCGTCICPEGFGGDYCETSGPMSPGCTPSSGEITVTSQTEQCVSTPQWPSMYSNAGHTCNWILKAGEPSGRVEYYFKGRFWMTYGSGDGRCFHWAEIKDGNNATLRGKRYCGDTAPTFTRTSLTDTVVVHFSAEYPSTGYGFQLCYKLASTTEPEVTTADPATTSTTASPGGGDACSSSPCLNGASCTALAPGGFACTCRPHYTGDRCQTRDKCVKASGKPRCVEEYTDSCQLTDTKRGFACSCRLGFTGAVCQRSVCKNRCRGQNAERCEVDAATNTHRCVCRQGWGGAQCTKNTVDECDSNPCQNGATCRDLNNKFRCKCPPGFKGRLCQKPK